MFNWIKKTEVSQPEPFDESNSVLRREGVTDLITKLIPNDIPLYQRIPKPQYEIKEVPFLLFFKKKVRVLKAPQNIKHEWKEM